MSLYLDTAGSIKIPFCIFADTNSITAKKNLKKHEPNTFIPPNNYYYLLLKKKYELTQKYFKTFCRF